MFKKKNLERSAEPYAVMSYMLGNEWPEEYLKIGWKQFMKCQPHDTIGGCGVDKVEMDAMARLRETNYIANLVTVESLKEVQLKVDTSSIDSDSMILTAYNPSIYSRSEIVDAYVDIPRELDLESFIIEDTIGNNVSFNAENTQYFGKVFRDHTDLALQSYADEFRIKFEAALVPAMGYKTFILKKGTETEAASIVTEETTLENEFIKASVNTNGTVNITNKETGEVYKQLNYFHDTGDVGNVWSYVQPINDKGITTRALTLMRGYENNICTSGDWQLEYRPGELSQSIGKHEFNYSIYTGSVEDSYTNLHEEISDRSAACNRNKVRFIAEKKKIITLLIELQD